MAFTWPLTGRSEEMHAIEAAVSEPERSGIVIYGAAGVGKSRIAREALASAASRGCETRWVTGTSSAMSLPLGAFASWAGSGDAPALDLVRRVTEALTSSSNGATVVVGVDDAHLLDDLSTFVLHQIVQRRAARLMLTVRDGDPIPVGTQEIWKGGEFDRLDMQPLSRNETVTLLSSTLGAPVDPDAAGRLWTLTRGNVLYLRNIVEQEVADGRLAQRDHHWRWMGDAVVPPGLVELIEARIGALPAGVGDVIDALAIGEPIEVRSLVRITDAKAVEDAEMRGLVMLEKVDGRQQARLAHPLYGEVRRERTASMRLRRLRGRVAKELATCDGRDDMRIVVRRAALSLESDLRPDPQLLTRAAQGAVWLGIYRWRIAWPRPRSVPRGRRRRTSFAGTPCLG